ncbi:MAG: guanylate kinase [Alistipes sp.]|nr:guanylate kinase [Alistipes sp.]
MENNKGVLVLFSGPSGVGKDTVLEIVLAKDTSLQKSVSCTTRGIRENEIDGKDYYFITVPEFEEMIENHEVLEFTRYGQNFYGTPKAPIDKWLSEGKTVILKIEVEGASNIKKLYPDSVGIFIMPPSMEVLEQRLRSRGTEGEADIKKRLEIAHSEIGHSKVYDYLVVNDDLEKTSENVLDILHKLYK